MESLASQLIVSLEMFNETLLADLAQEETELSLELSEKIFTKREAYWFNRELALHHSCKTLSVLVPWVVSNLMDPTQIRAFVLYYRFSM